MRLAQLKSGGFLDAGGMVDSCQNVYEALFHEVAVRG